MSDAFSIEAAQVVHRDYFIVALAGEGNVDEAFEHLEDLLLVKLYPVIVHESAPELS